MGKIEIKKIKPAFEDHRGAITDLSDEQIRHIGIITSKPGAVRGKHYHKKATQYTYVLSGKIELLLKDLNEENPKAVTLTMSPGDIITIPPNVIHVIKSLNESTILVFSNISRIDGGYENDTVRVDI